MTEADDASRPLGVGVVGAGTIVFRQAAGFRAHPDAARLVAVADLSWERAEAAQRQYGFQVALGDYRDLLKRDDVDLVSVCTRPDSHEELVRAAVEAGKHVLCEKPLARSLAEADRLIARCDARPELAVCTVYQWRAHPAFAFVRGLLEEGELGRPLLAEMRLRTVRPISYYTIPGRRETFRVDGGGLLGFMAIHQLDLLLALLGEPVEVSACMEHFHAPGPEEDAAVGWVRFRSGALATIRASAVDHEDRFSLDVTGERAGLRVEGGGSKIGARWSLRSNEAARERRLRRRGRREAPRRPDPGFAAVQWFRRFYRLAGRTWWPPRSWWHGPFIGEVLDSIRGDRPVPVPPREARRSIELATALYQSASLKEPARLPLDERSPFYAGVDPTRVAAPGGAGA